CCLVFLFFHGDAAHRALHSFPTRRSSDLLGPRDEREDDGSVGGYRTSASRKFLSTAWSRRPRAGSLPGVRRSTTSCGSGRALASDRKSTRLNSSHVKISYAVFCLKKKK